MKVKTKAKVEVEVERRSGTASQPQALPRRFDIPAREPILSVMRKWISVCLLLTTAAVVSAGCDRWPSSGLGIELRSSHIAYTTDGDFCGTLTFVNRGVSSIHESFPTSCQYQVVFYDQTGTIRRHYPIVAFQMPTGLYLGPFDSQVEVLRFSISNRPDTTPAGLYRVRAWVEGHEDIYSETIVAVSPAM